MGGELRGSGQPPIVGLIDTHDHGLVLAQLAVEAAAVERLARAYAGLARARLEASDPALIPRSAPVSTAQLRLVVGG